MAFPRMLAMAEDVWSTPENKNFADFQRRLSANFAHLDKQNVNYRIPEPTGLENRVLAQTEGVNLDMTPSVPGAKLFYTIDGSTPTDKSQLYTKPTGILEEPARDRMDVKVIEVLPSGRTSSVYTATFLRRPWHGPEQDLKDKRPGATFAFVVPSDGDALGRVVISGETRSTGLQQFANIADLKQPFAVAFDGYFNAPIDAIYELQVDSTWAATLVVDKEPIIEYGNTKDIKHGSGLVPLRAGLHKLSLRYHNGGGDPYFRVRWAIKGQNWRNIGGGELVH